MAERTSEHGLDLLSSATAYMQNDLIRQPLPKMEPQDPPRPRKRRRAALSCEQCRQRKLKCDRSDPCGACVKSRLPACVYKDNSAIVAQSNASRELQSHTPSLPISSQPHQSSITSSILPPSPAVTQSPLIRPSEQQHAAKQHLPLDGLEHMNPAPLRGIRGTYTKNRLYGESHWTSYLTTSSIAIEGIREIAHEGFSDAFGLLAKCKALAREVKTQESPDDIKLREGESLLPSRSVADMLVQAYLRTTDKVFHVLDVPQFMGLYEQYWRDSTNVPSGFHASMILVFANGAAVCPDHGLSRKNIIHWIYVASRWLNQPRAKMRMNLWSLRTHCLLLLARQSNGVDGKMTALSAGSLVVTAMHMGLHVDPVHFAESQVPQQEYEVRRRLWAAVLELELQANIDSGGRPLIREDDFDCMPPSNVDEASSSGATNRRAASPLERYTQSSVQILLARSIRIRLKIARFVNDFRPAPSYQEALALSKELVEDMRQSTALIEGWRKANAPISQFQIELYNLLMQRFLLALHYNYALKAKDEPLFYYSRKICLDSSFSLLSPPVLQRDPDFYRAVLHGCSVFQDVYTAAANFLSEYVCAENANTSLLMPSPGTSSENHLIAAIEGHLPLSLARVEAGQTNVKAQLLMRCLLTFAKAIHNGTDVKNDLRKAINISLEDAYAALRTRLEGSSPASEPAGNMPLGDDVSLENLLGWLQGDDVFGSNGDNMWLNGFDWSGGNDGTMAGEAPTM